jgi:hypothetical protein
MRFEEPSVHVPGGLFRVDGRQPFRYAPERPTAGKVRFARYPSAIANMLVSLRTRQDSYCNLNGGRGIGGQVEVPPPPTEPEMTTLS